MLRRAYDEADVTDPELTDESALVERLGVKIAIVEGSSRNIKITREEDFIIGEAILKNSANKLDFQKYRGLLDDLSGNPFLILK